MIKLIIFNLFIVTALAETPPPPPSGPPFYLLGMVALDPT